VWGVALKQFPKAKFAACHGEAGIPTQKNIPVTEYFLGQYLAAN
jgi:hypothetical protein